MHASLHIFPSKENVTKTVLSQINKSEWKEAKYELLHNTSCFLKINLWRVTVHLRRVILCTTHAQQAFLSILIGCIP